MKHLTRALQLGPWSPSAQTHSCFEYHKRRRLCKHSGQPVLCQQHSKVLPHVQGGTCCASASAHCPIAEQKLLHPLAVPFRYLWENW